MFQFYKCWILVNLKLLVSLFDIQYNIINFAQIILLNVDLINRYVTFIKINEIKP